jgi:hypothetical protein
MHALALLLMELSRYPILDPGVRAHYLSVAGETKISRQLRHQRRSDGAVLVARGNEKEKKDKTPSVREEAHPRY